MHIASSCSNNRYTSSRSMHQVYIIPSSLSRKGLEHQFLHILICPLLKFLPSNQSVKPACYNYFFKSLTLHWLCIKTLDSLPGICMTACTSSTSYLLMQRIPSKTCGRIQICCCCITHENFSLLLIRDYGNSPLTTYKFTPFSKTVKTKSQTQNLKNYEPPCWDQDFRQFNTKQPPCNVLFLLGLEAQNR